MDAFDNGWFGQAIRERYAFDGQITANGTVNSTDMLIDNLITSDMEGYLADDDDRLPATNETLRAYVVKFKLKK